MQPGRCSGRYHVWVVGPRRQHGGNGTVPAVLPIPSVSVCLPVYNGERFLAETIRSVLDQTYRDFELVVLDNASTDQSGTIARSFSDPRIRIERNRETLQQADNWNRVVELARGPLVKVVCADDLLHPRCLELQVGPMDADPGLAVVAARRHMIDEQSRVLVPRRGLSGLIGVRTGVEVARRVVRTGANPIGESNNVLFRRDDFFTVGGWKTDRPNVMDLDLWLRLLQLGDFLGLPETLAAFRIARDSISSHSDQKVYEQQRMLIEELGESPYFQVRGIDLTVGRMLAPAGRARRRALYTISKVASRSDVA
jgi:glycosyltransferase involved in cell wall biosynthesis